MPTFEVADQGVHELVAGVMRDHHTDLEGAAVTVDVLMAHGTAGKLGIRGPAVKVHGRSCAAKVRITKLPERVAGRADCEITLDGDRWPNWSRKTQEAVIDHELTHLWLDMTKDTDDAGRPRLKTVLHDHEWGWFDDVVEHYGTASMEVQQYVGFRDGPLTQLWLPHMGPERIHGSGNHATRTRRRGRGKEAAVKD